MAWTSNRARQWWLLTYNLEKIGAVMLAFNVLVVATGVGVPTPSWYWTLGVVFCVATGCGVAAVVIALRYDR